MGEDADYYLGTEDFTQSIGISEEDERVMRMATNETEDEAELQNRVYSLERQVKFLQSQLAPKVSKILSYWIECGYCGRKANLNELHDTFECKCCSNESKVIFNIKES